MTILDRISLVFEPGAPTVLIGPNGSGKTTLLRAAMGLVPISRGRITWAGGGASPPTRRAILLQRPVMLRRTAAGNIRYALGAAGGPRSKHHQRGTGMLSLGGFQGMAGRPARRRPARETPRRAL